MILTMVKSMLSKPPADCLQDGAEMCGRLTTTQKNNSLSNHNKKNHPNSCHLLNEGKYN